MDMVATSKKLLLACGLVASWAGPLCAGKLERDMQKEEEQKSKAKAEGVKKACGCDVTITVKWDTYKKADDMKRITYAVGSLVTAAKKQCSGKDRKPDAANSKAFCDAVKEYEISFSDDDKDIIYDKNKKLIKAYSNDIGYTGDVQLIEFLDKF